ncbi:hypothetical protein [Hyphomicrobium sulfonivorans]|uniref:hypothetical protein n=1 Tax=Hyphomicrobium sulfonivorans TaxID=121290 RepID=UPI00156D7965|nr:hypothetical protein [Hyphomicrobium sulfonivorans]MBI1649980.1 hypothetical protein [Hyphomicrobium sulfonivorans]
MTLIGTPSSHRKMLRPMSFSKFAMCELNPQLQRWVPASSIAMAPAIYLRAAAL